MRSVVVVLPASMWAVMPMLRYRSMGVLRGTVKTFFHRREAEAPRNAGENPDNLCKLFLCVFAPLRLIILESVMRERLVLFRHAVHFLALFHGAAAAFRCFCEFAGKPRTHRFLAAPACRIAQPAHPQGRPAGRSRFPP